MFKVSINFSKSPHQIFLLFLRCCYWNPNKKGRVNVSDGSRQKWIKNSGEGCWKVWRKRTFIIYKLIKCSNPNTPLPWIFFSFLSGPVWDIFTALLIGVPTTKSIKKQKHLMGAFWEIAWYLKVRRKHKIFENSSQMALFKSYKSNFSPKFNINTPPTLILRMQRIVNIAT